MVAVTTTGLRADGTAATELPDVAWAIAAGTADVITADYDDAVTALSDGLILGFRASAANATATPTFSPDGLTAHTIVKRGGVALLAGDIPGALAECLVRYNLANTRWELLNPASGSSGLGAGVPWVAAGGTVDVITATYAPAVLALTDGLLLSFRASGANTSVTPTFSPNSLTARTIVRQGGAALNIGDISTNSEAFVRYNLANTRWELLNPANGQVLMKILTASEVGADVNTAQPWFPTAGAVSVAIGTYLVEGFLLTTRVAGTTSHTTGILFGGTATIGNAVYQAFCKEGDANDLQDVSSFVSSDPLTVMVIKAASTSATENVLIRIAGIFRITVAGTFIPQFKYSAAPGGAPTISYNSYFRMEPTGSHPFATQGTWA